MPYHNDARYTIIGVPTYALGGSKKAVYYREKGKRYFNRRLAEFNSLEDAEAFITMKEKEE